VARNHSAPLEGLLMAGKRKPKDDKEQSRRFVETARKLGADEIGEAFERGIKTIVPPKRPRDSGKTDEHE
jgi:hypothetical protein